MVWLRHIILLRCSHSYSKVPLGVVRVSPKFLNLALKSPHIIWWWAVLDVGRELSTSMAAISDNDGGRYTLWMMYGPIVKER